jgi:hypothetical protein
MKWHVGDDFHQNVQDVYSVWQPVLCVVVVVSLVGEPLTRGGLGFCRSVDEATRAAASTMASDDVYLDGLAQHRGERHLILGGRNIDTQYLVFDT